MCVSHSLCVSPGLPPRLARRSCEWCLQCAGIDVGTPWADVRVRVRVRARAYARVCADMGADHLDGILNTTAGNLQAATYHDYWNDCLDNAPPLGSIMDPACIDARVAAVVDKYGSVVRRHATPLWLTEGALHSNSGVGSQSSVVNSPCPFQNVAPSRRVQISSPIGDL